MLKDQAFAAAKLSLKNARRPQIFKTDLPDWMLKMKEAWQGDRIIMFNGERRRITDYWEETIELTNPDGTKKITIAACVEIGDSVER